MESFGAILIAVFLFPLARAPVPAPEISVICRETEAAADVRLKALNCRNGARKLPQEGSAQVGRGFGMDNLTDLLLLAICLIPFPRLSLDCFKLGLNGEVLLIIIGSLVAFCWI